MSDMSMQEIFDTVVVHMVAQGGPAMDPLNARTRSTAWGRVPLSGGNECAYRAEDGKSCAIGCLLTEDEAKVMEGRSVQYRKSEGKLPERFGGVDIEFLMSLQRAHDLPSDIDDPNTYMRKWRDLMAGVASQCKLSPSKLDELFHEVSP